MRDFYSSDLDTDLEEERVSAWADKTLEWAVQSILMQLSIEVSTASRSYLNLPLTTK